MEDTPVKGPEIDGEQPEQIPELEGDVSFKRLQVKARPGTGRYATNKRAGLGKIRARARRGQGDPPLTDLSQLLKPVIDGSGYEVMQKLRSDKKVAASQAPVGDYGDMAGRLIQSIDNHREEGNHIRIKPKLNSIRNSAPKA